MTNLHYYFENDSSHCCKISIKMQPPYNDAEVYFLADFSSATIYISVYFKKLYALEFYKNFIDYITSDENRSQNRGESIKLPDAKLTSGRHFFVDNYSSFGISSKFYSEDIKEELSSLTLSPRIYIYSEESLNVSDLESLIKHGDLKKMKIKFLSKEYLKEIEAYKHPVAFISHDSRDKLEVAQPLARALIESGFPVWYDEYSLKPGDSLTESIDQGIKECKKCMLILSPNFLSNTGWCKEEFKAAYMKKINNKDNTIVPIWVNVSKDDVYGYNAVLADTVAIHWNQGIKKVCEKLSAVLN